MKLSVQQTAALKTMAKVLPRASGSSWWYLQASGSTLASLVRLGLAEETTMSPKSSRQWRITEAGRRAIAEPLKLEP